MIVAALGSADWIVALQNKSWIASWRRLATALTAGGWSGISAALAATGMMPEYWMRGIGAAKPGKLRFG